MWIDQKIGLSISSRLRIKVMPKIEKSAVAGIIIIIIWMVAPRTTTPILQKCSKKFSAPITDRGRCKYWKRRRQISVKYFRHKGPSNDVEEILIKDPL